jgi:2-amino-4-hydroxy-6-hydroxymethyldihydropteridine diphosphokinase
MTEVFIGIGSNLGDRQANIISAVKTLSHHAKIKQTSSLFETAPEGFINQPDFLNCVVSIETDVKPMPLLRLLRKTEKGLGRQESFRNAPRPIDLDILFYGDQLINQKGMEIPHPRLHERAFVLVPMVQIAPQFVHPALHKTMQQLLSELAKGKRVEKWGELSLDFNRS